MASPLTSGRRVMTAGVRSGTLLWLLVRQSWSEIKNRIVANVACMCAGIRFQAAHRLKGISARKD
jgi:hypothetical protein